MAMTVDQAVQRTYLLATGKATMPTVDSTKYTKILALLNLYKDVWAKESGVQWASQRQFYTLPSTVSATGTYSISAISGSPSSQEGDFVRILHTDGIKESDYTLVPASRLYNDGPSRNNPGTTDRNANGRCTISGTSLIFDVPFTATSAQFGGSILIPVYVVPTDMRSSSVAVDNVPVDDPNWACFMAAAAYVATDLTRQYLGPGLIAQARDSMDYMMDQNETQLEEIYTGGWNPMGHLETGAFN